VTADNLGKDEINCENVRYTRSRPRPAAASAAEDDRMMLVVVVCESCRAVRVWRQKRAEF
jgi:hypothetical protein